MAESECALIISWLNRTFKRSVYYMAIVDDVLSKLRAASGSSES